MQTLTTFDAVLTQLGGYDGIGRLTGSRSSAVSMWRARGERFPALHYAAITTALRRRGCECPRSLFTFRRPNSCRKSTKRKRSR